ncbi:hypothetical protein RND81_10G181800 [Saponaria officinalis]|uniref:DUF3615 domain-containing protein n=1 Tax=Saponaria officinalis TaxID=3572 RepID=A0AAW1I601_SAPOF
MLASFSLIYCDRDNEPFQESSLRFANAALSYLREQGHNFELVRLGMYEAAIIGGGSLYHYNFKAKRADDPNSAVEMFFPQLFYHRRPGNVLQNLKVEFCVSLGDIVSLPDHPYPHGCMYCESPHIHIHHPVDGGWSGIKKTPPKRRKSLRNKCRPSMTE